VLLLQLLLLPSGFHPKCVPQAVVLRVQSKQCQQAGSFDCTQSVLVLWLRIWKGVHRWWYKLGILHKSAIVEAGVW
jgi:hypothetical protein